MATWALTAQLVSGTLSVNATDHVWWNGASFGTNITVGAYQDSTHIADSTDAQRDTVSSVHNTKYIDATHVSIDGAASTSLPIATNSCGLLFTFSDPSLVATSAAKFYAYDGITDTNPMGGVNFQAAEGGHSTQWVAANGFNSALSLADQAAATSHSFYVATSLSPTSSGLKSGKIKILLTYV